MALDLTKIGTTTNVANFLPTKVLTAQNTAPSTQINLTPKPDNTNYTGIIAGATQSALATTPSGATVNPETGAMVSAPPQEAPQQDPTAGIKDYINSITGVQQPSAVDTYKQGYDASGLAQQQADINAKAKITTDAQARLGNISAQLQALNAEATAVPIQVQSEFAGTGATRGGAAPIETARLRDIALRALPLQAQGAVVQAEVAAAQGNQQLAQDLYTQAQTHFDKVFELQMTDLNNQYTFKTNLIDKVYAFADKQQQAALTKQAAELQNTRAVEAATIAYNRDLQKQEIQNKFTASQKSAGGLGINGLSNITNSIISNPSLFDDLTPTVKGTVISELQAQGYDTSNLGVKGLSDTAITSIAQTQKALDDLATLKTTIEGKSDMLGPLKGMAALNPYSEARKLQADVNRVRQTVGKALEGGVLRKEDEEKYKQILATLTDTPSTALYKIDALVSSIQRDIENYKSLQQAGGRSLDVGASLQKKGTATNAVDWQKKYNY